MNKLQASIESIEGTVTGTVTGVAGQSLSVENGLIVAKTDASTSLGNFSDIYGVPAGGVNTYRNVTGRDHLITISVEYNFNGGVENLEAQVDLPGVGWCDVAMSGTEQANQPVLGNMILNITFFVQAGQQFRVQIGDYDTTHVYRAGIVYYL